MTTPNQAEPELPASDSTAVATAPPADPTAPDASGPPGPDLPKVGPRYIWLMVLAQFGVFMAFITPIAISLAIRVQELAPGQDQYLGFITGAGAMAVMFAAPFLGIWSDRNRTRFGRRRPFMVGGMFLGLLALVVMAQASSILVLGIGWVLAQLGWGTTLSNLQTSTADRLPESQRGKVAGLTGFATQVAPTFGVLIGGRLAGDSMLLFLVPGLIGALLVTLFVTLVHEDDSRGITFEEPATVTNVLRKYLFNPRQHQDFSWNWLGRFLFYFGLTLNTTFTAFFFASRLDTTVEQVAGVIASLSLFGVIATSVGAIGGGFLSDRLHRRRVLVLLGGVIMAAGMTTAAFSSSIVMLAAGSVLSSLGLGLFSAIDQALLLDVLPDREHNAGRFMAITGFATSIPQSVAPLIAPFILGIGVAAGADKNYTLLFLVAAAFVLAGGLVIQRIRSVR